MFLCSTNHQFQAPSGSWPSAGLTTRASARLAIRRRHMFSAPRFVSDTDDCTHVHQGTSSIYEQPFILRVRRSAAHYDHAIVNIAVVSRSAWAQSHVRPLLLFDPRSAMKRLEAAVLARRSQYGCWFQQLSLMRCSFRPTSAQPNGRPCSKGDWS